MDENKSAVFELIFVLHLPLCKFQPNEACYKKKTVGFRVPRFPSQLWVLNSFLLAKFSHDMAKSKQDMRRISKSYGKNLTVLK